MKQNLKPKFYPVDKKRWQDFEAFFESKGCPHYCWCSVWRNYTKDESYPEKVAKKISMKERICDNIPTGILAYLDKHPVAWCSVAPRETYKKLNGIETNKKVWSIVCFFVKRPFRNKGIHKMLLNEAVKYAKSNAAELVEAYPVERDSPSYRFMGFKDIFEKAGFKYIKNAGSRRYVYCKEI